MPRVTVRDKVAALSPERTRQISQMAQEFHSIVEIAKKHELDYVVVRTLLWDQGTLSLQGAKSIITRRLRKLRAASRQEYRVELKEDIEEQVNYLYYAAKQLQDKLDKGKKAIP